MRYLDDMIQPHCIKHQDREGIYFCSKYNTHLCEECLSCQDPKDYCKFRSSCIINEIVKHGTTVKRHDKSTLSMMSAHTITE